MLAIARDESITAQVLADNRVCYQEQTMSLSAAAVQVLNQLGYRSQNASGASYWMYEGELLGERRQRMEAQHFDVPAED